MPLGKLGSACPRRCPEAQSEMDFVAQRARVGCMQGPCMCVCLCDQRQLRHPDRFIRSHGSPDSLDPWDSRVFSCSCVQTNQSPRFVSIFPDAPLQGVLLLQLRGHRCQASPAKAEREQDPRGGLGELGGPGALPARPYPTPHPPADREEAGFPTSADNWIFGPSVSGNSLKDAESKSPNPRSLPAPTSPSCQ